MNDTQTATLPNDVAALVAAWSDAFAAFTGAFDTPVARRNQNDEFAADARQRMRAFNEQMRELAKRLPERGGADAP